MTEQSKQERDHRALDALIVSQLRRHERCDGVDIDTLPKLTKEEKAALDSLGPDFIGRLLAGDVTPISDDGPPAENDELLCAGGMSFGLNRAEEVDQRTAEEIERMRNEVIERLKQRENQHD